MSDIINHPPHYTGHPSGVECIEITGHMGFCLGNAVKYLCRAVGRNSIDYNGGRLTLSRSRDLAAQALAALRAAGYAIVKLPEPEPGEAAWPIDYPRKNGTSWVFVTENSRIGFPPYRVDSSQARQLAAALLAAANAAEEGK